LLLHDNNKRALKWFSDYEKLTQINKMIDNVMSNLRNNIQL